MSLAPPPSRARLAGLLALALLAASCGLDEFPTGASLDAHVPPSPPPDNERPDAATPDRASGPEVNRPPPRDAGRPPDTNGGPAPADGPSTTLPDPGSGESLVIGGVARPKDKVIVFLHIGHSNMAGRTNTPAEMRPFYFETDPRLWSFAGAMWTPAKEPLSGDFLTRGRAGPGMAILRTALGMAPADAVMVSIGKGQDGSRGGACKNYRRGGLLYDFVMGPAKQLKGKVVFGGIFSMLVLMEIYDKPNLPRSHECMEGVARDMREDLEDPNIPFMMSDWEMGATGRFSPTLPDATMARAQLKIAQQNIQRSAIIPTEMLPMSDDHHFDLVGYKMWAERAFAIMQMSGWVPWTGER